jgi:predicted phosphate transport protein (TIGR00153 family)
MQFFGKKELRIIQLFDDHMVAVENTVKSLIDFLKNIENPDLDRESFVEKIRKNESDADDKRRKMETEMYLGAFLPNFRGDLLGIAESIDVVANKAESTADLIELQNISIPKEFIPKLIELAEKSLETYLSVKKAASSIFNDMDVANDLINRTEDLEHETDILEKNLVRTLFRKDEIELAHKIQLEKLIKKLADIADQAENVSDRLQIVIFKRRV